MEAPLGAETVATTPPDKKLLALLSCRDFRLEWGRLGLSKWSLYKVLLPKLRNMLVLHLSYLEPLGVGHVYAATSDRERWRYLRNKYVGRTSLKIREMSDIPLSRYLHKLYLFGDGTVGALYYAPREIMDEMIARLDSFYEEVRPARVYPVMNCHGRLWPDVGVEEAEEMGRAVLEKLDTVPPYRSRNRFLDYMLVSVLEWEPLLTTRGLRRLVYAVDARIEKELGEEIELDMGYIRRHYRELSKRYILGRIFVARQDVCNYPLFIVDREYRELLYGLASATMGSTILVDTGDTAIASLAITSFKDERSFARNILLRGLEKITTHLWSIISPFPFEMYNPITGEWGLEKPAIENLEKLVKKYRLSSQR